VYSGHYLLDNRSVRVSISVIIKYSFRSGKDVTVHGETLWRGGLGFVVFADIKVKTDGMRGPYGSKGKGNTRS
jgi:hypothetical protein